MIVAAAFRGCDQTASGGARVSGNKLAWKQYQEDVANLLVNLGFSVEVEDRITSARGVTHEVDVSARRTIASVEVLWVVECKLWQSRVKKEKVATLVAICEDIGADRGLLMSQNGFQSGAIQMANGRNITLSSLEDLRVNTLEEMQLARQHQADARLRAVESSLRRAQATTVNQNAHELVKVLYLYGLLPEERAQRALEDDARFTRPDLAEVQARLPELYPDIAFRSEGIPPYVGSAEVWTGPDQLEVNSLIGQVSLCRTNLHEGVVGEWPVVMQDENGDLRTTWSMAQLLPIIETWVEHLDQASKIQLATLTLLDRDALPWTPRS